MAKGALPDRMKDILGRTKQNVCHAGESNPPVKVEAVAAAFNYSELTLHSSILATLLKA